MQPCAASIDALARGDPKRKALARNHDLTVAAERTGERADVPGKDDVVEFKGTVTGSVMKRRAAVEVEAVDGERTEIEFAGPGEPVDPSVRIEPEIERHPADRELHGAPFAPHQRAEAELDVELVGTHLAEIVGAADDE